MKARVKATGEIVEIYEWSRVVGQERCQEYTLDELELVEGKTNYTSDYWDKLLHQYAGMTMQVMLAANATFTADDIAKWSIEYATALVGQLKNK